MTNILYTERSWKKTYRNDYFDKIRKLPWHTRTYRKIRYIIRTHGKH